MLQRLPPEAAHHLALRGLGLLRRCWRAPPASGLDVDLFGHRFAHPIGLAAGFDKNGDHLDALGALGFSHIEVGTVTPRPQPGNPRPRLFRLRGARALINRMGFNNRGAEYVAQQLRRASWRGVRGVSIGKNADTPLERAADDYIACLRQLYPLADYFAINVSSPNTRGLRELQAAAALAGIVEPLQEERQRLAGASRPARAPAGEDLAGSGRGQLSELCGALRRHALDGALDGVIATNSSTDLPGFEAELQAREGGGISGAPLAAKSLELLRRLRGELGADFPIIGVGGLMSPEAVLERLAAGANLVQLYTGFVYRGPALLWDSLQRLTQPR